MWPLGRSSSARRAVASDLAEQNGPAVEASEALRTIAYFDRKAGKVRGFKVFPGPNRKSFLGLGLHPGDLVTSINGMPLDGSRLGQQALDALSAPGQVNLTIERGTRTESVVLKLSAEAPAND
jgi:hypothetical protein